MIMGEKKVNYYNPNLSAYEQYIVKQNDSLQGTKIEPGREEERLVWGDSMKAATGD